MEESLQSTLLLAQRTADEVKAAAHKEADLIKQEARLQSEREIGSLGDKVEESRREHQRMLDIAEKAKSEIRSLLLSHLALIDRAPYDAASAPTPAHAEPAVTAAQAAPVEPVAPAVTHVTVESSLINDIPLPPNHASAARFDL
jgi:cell division septum initiation protein DivIVA